MRCALLAHGSGCDVATTYPDRLGPDEQDSEQIVFEALRRLPESWRVFHSVAWQSRRGRRQGDGEADFIVLSPEHGALILEVKGGSIEVINGSWFSTNRFGQRFEIKNPFEQAVKSKYALRFYLENLDPPILNFPISHAVSFPHGSVGANIGMYGPRVLILDKADLRDISPSMKRIFSHWEVAKVPSKKQLDRITTLLAPTTVVRSRLRNELADVEAQLIQLTDQQVRALHGLKRWRRAAVLGGPGTGKTILAAQRVRELVDDGFRPFFTCFNAPLSESIQREFTTLEGVATSTFHGLCFSLASKARLPLPTDPSTEWWETGAPELLLEAAARLGFEIGALVIDEGQDFVSSWIDALLMLLEDPDESPAYIFADTQQAVYRQGWSFPSGWPPPYELSINCRSSLPIARVVAAVYGDPPLSIGTEGPSPVWVNAPDEESAMVMVQDIADRLLTEELLEPSQVTVLCDSRRAVERLRQRSTSTAAFVERGRNGVAVETIHRFKGLESAVILLCLGGQHESAELKMLSYVGMSRARSLLVVIGTPVSRQAIGWPG